MPKFFGAWLDKSMPSCVFTPTQLRVFKQSELQASPWYVECAKNYAPAEEEDEKNAAIALPASTPSMVEQSQDDDDDAVVEIPDPLSADKKKGKARARRSPTAGGSSNGLKRSQQMQPPRSQRLRNKILPH